MKTALKILVSLILLAIIVWKLGGLKEVTDIMGGVKLCFVLMIFLVNGIDRALMTFKWAMLLRTRGVHMPFFQAMRIYCASSVWGIFLPTTVGPDAIRAFSVSRIGIDLNEIIASILIERAIGFIAALVLGVAGLVILSSLSNLGPQFDMVWILAGVSIVGAALLFSASFSEKAFDFIHGRMMRRFWNHRIMLKLRQFHSTYMQYRAEQGGLWAFFGLTLGEQLLQVFYTWLVAVSLGIHVNILFIAGALPLSLLVSWLPISIHGLGVFDGIFIVLMSLAGVTPAEAIAITFLGRILQIASWLPFWMSHVISSGQIRPPRPSEGPV